MQQTSRAGIPPDCVRLAEKLALVAFRLFPRPLWFDATEYCGAVGREPACVASKVCQLCDCEDRLSACAARYSPPARVLVLLLSSLLSMFNGEIYLRLNERSLKCYAKNSTYIYRFR